MSDKRARATDYAQAIVQAMLERWQSSLTQAAEAISKGGKGDDIDALLPKGTPVELVNALKLMQQRDDLNLINEVASALGQIVSGRKEPTRAEVVSAEALSEADQDQMRKSLSQQYGEGITFSFRVDPSLLGGLRVRVGDRLIDTSIASRLTALRESLTAVTR